MPEAEELLSGRRTAGTDEVLVHERVEVAPDRCPSLRREEIGDRVGRELLADDRGTVEHGPLAGAEAIETRCEQGLDRGRERDVSAVQAGLGGHGQQLLEEEGIAVGGGRDPGPCGRGKRDLAEQVVEQ